MFKNIKRKLKYISPFSIMLRYIGWLGYGNTGDEFLYKSIQNLFPKFILIPYIRTRMLFWQRISGTPFFQGSVLGGGTLINKRTFYFELSYVQKNYSPSFIFGTGVAHPEFWRKFNGYVDIRLKWCDLLRSASYVGVRGPISKYLLEDVGFLNAEVVGDPALSLAKENYLVKKGSRHLGINIGVTRGFLWGSEHDILERIVQFGKIMVKRGWKISFFPVWHEDRDYIDVAARRINSNSVDIFEDYLDISKTLEFLSSCDVFVGEKLHSVVLAHCARTPSIMLEYRPKCRDYMESMDMEEMNIRTDRIDVDQLVSEVEALYERNDEIQARINMKVIHYKKLQHKRANMITKAIMKDSAE